MVKRKKAVSSKDVKQKKVPSKKETKALVPSGEKVASKKKVKRVPVGIKNLDKIIEGGFEKNSTNLIVGGSGSGKSIFTIQFLIEGVKKGENVLYVAFEE